MAKKHIDYVNASSLGSYFGVGFNSPEEQIDIDLGITESVFDDESMARMQLGNFLEDSALDYFEWLLKIKITDRNDAFHRPYEGKMMCKLDGMTMWPNADGEYVKTVVENKISNAQSGKFTENFNYLMQCHMYMIAADTDQCLLLGLYQGKPIYKVITKDPEMVKDIYEMVDFIYGVLIGLEDFEDYPVHLLQKYSQTVLLDDLEGVTGTHEDKLRNLIVLKERQKALGIEVKGIETEIKETFQTGKFKNEFVSLTLSESTRKGGYDMDALSISHPEIDLEKFRKPNTHSRTLRVKGL